MGAVRGGSGSPITALLVDEDAMTRRGVRDLLEADRISVVGETSAAEEVVAQAAELAPTVVLMGLGTRSASGVDATRRVCGALPRCRVLMLTGSSEPADVEGALRAGARGYLLKDDPPGEIVAGVRAAAAGGLPLSPRVAAGLVGHLLDGTGGAVGARALTARERSVLRLLSAGQPNPEIAENLSISVSTVKRHVTNVLAKLGAANRTQAAAEAARRGLI
jgi:DNA-binding NarL/FixJ family response regulator